MAHDPVRTRPLSRRALLSSSGRLAAALGASGLGLGSGLAHAEGYPDKPITIIIPYAPGGSVDYIGRIVGEQLSRRLGQPVVIDNRAGAGGYIGMGAAARARPDGYTLVFASLGVLTVTVHLTKPPFDPLKDVAPISLVATSPLVIGVNADSPYKTLGDVIAAARAKPGSISYSVTGIGSQTYLTGELLKKTLGISMVPIQYKGGGPAATAIASGEVPVGITDSGPMLPLVKAGKIRFVAVTAPKRFPGLPDVPTVAESGVPGFDVDTALGLFAPAGTPPSVIDLLAKTVREACATEEMKSQLLTASHQTVGSTPEQLGAFVKSEYAKWGKVIEEGHIKIE